MQSMTKNIKKWFKVTGEGDAASIVYTPSSQAADAIAQIISENGYYPHVEEVAYCVVPANIRMTY